MKKCLYCNVENPKKATYCRKCGLSFIPQKKSKKELKEIESLTAKWKSYPREKRPITGLLMRSCILAVISAFVTFLVGFTLETIGKEEAMCLIIAIGSGVLFFLAGTCINVKQLPTKKERELFSSLYDLIEPYSYLGLRHSRKRKLYKIFLKGEKMGLMDVSNYRIAIDPHYSSMKWKQKQKVLTVTLNNDTFDINTEGDYL